jgi:hypothetical protein
MNRTWGWALSIAVVTALAAFAAVRSAHGAEPDDETDISFVVQVCEGSKGEVPINEETNGRTCDKPISKAQVRLIGNGISVGPVMTGTSGIARLGPVRIKTTAKFGIAVTCEEHDDLLYEDLRIGNGRVHAGENKLMAFTTLAE